MKQILISILFLFVLFSESWATTGAVAIPGSITYSVNANAPVSITWGVTGPVGSHTSIVGKFIHATTGGQIGGSSINTSLTIPCIASTTIICSPRTETFRIPVNVLSEALASGLTTMLYTRTFTDGVPSTGTVLISLTSSYQGSKLSITRESLRFSDNKIIKVIKPDAPLNALAELKYTGTGLLDAFWEYASPVSNVGNPIFIRLSSVRSYLGAGGRVILQSPKLPNQIEGQYLLRLNIFRTASNPNGVEFTNNIPDDLPILRYVVSNIREDAKADASPPIKTITPLNNAFLQQNTNFSWQVVQGANAYQLELYLADAKNALNVDASNQSIDDAAITDKEPASGLLIPASKTSLFLSPLARKSLQQGQLYYWRIIAIDADGQVLTSSELSAIRLP